MGQIELLGVGTLPGTSVDKSGLVGNQIDGTPHNRLGGLGSAIDYTGKNHRYVLVSDRGPKDGATDYACRFHQMDINIQPGHQEPVQLKLIETTMLTDEQGRPLVGTLSAIDRDHPQKSLRFDAEAVRCSPQNTLYIAEEYGSAISEFNLKGQRLRTLPLPARFYPERIGLKPEEELPPHSRMGRQPNRGIEGLALSSDGNKLYALFQSPLIQDGGLDKENKRIGLNARLLELDIKTQQTREFVYPLDEATNGLNEILAVNDHQFLCIERDSKAGLEAKFKKIYLIDLHEASDVSGNASLPVQGLPAGVKAVTKKLMIDLLDPRYGQVGAEFPEKIEGLTFGPELPDGRTLLLITADNDFIATAPFRVYAFAIPKGTLRRTTR